MAERDWSAGVDVDRPSAARIYDYFLGGSHNFAVDRDAAEKVLAVQPTVRFIAEANRAFLFRAVQYLVDAGVRQFLDIGSGIPTSGSVHQIAQELAPDSRVVYVDIDPVAITMCNTLLYDNDRATAIMADARKPEAVLGHPDARAMLDFDAPIGLLIVSLLHFIAGEEAYEMVGALGGALPPDSYLVLSHITPEEMTEEESEKIRAVYAKSTTPAGEARDRAGVLRFFDGFELVEPGLVRLADWCPDRPTPAGHELVAMLAGVGRKVGRPND